MVPTFGTNVKSQNIQRALSKRKFHFVFLAMILVVSLNIFIISLNLNIFFAENSTSKCAKKEAARDVLLRCSLVLLGNDQVQKILHKEDIHVWIKSTINQRDLDKLERRKDKGSIAQHAGMKRRLDAANETLERKIKKEDLAEDLFLDEYKKMKDLGKINEPVQMELLHFLSQICH